MHGNDARCARRTATRCGSAVSAETASWRGRAHLDSCYAGRTRALPLFGMPFAVKDNIDVAGDSDDRGVSRLRLRSGTLGDRRRTARSRRRDRRRQDQSRSVCDRTRRNALALRRAEKSRSTSATFRAARVRGRPLRSRADSSRFALGTDTAGSGRVPAGFNGIVGLKPTFGIISAAGVVPACRSLDCVSIFARSVDEAEAVLDVAAAPDPRDSFSRPRRAVPSRSRNCFASPCPSSSSARSAVMRKRSAASSTRWRASKRSAARRSSVDMAPCFAAAGLLYERRVRGRTNGGGRRLRASAPGRAARGHAHDRRGRQPLQCGRRVSRAVPHPRIARRRRARFSSTHRYSSCRRRRRSTRSKQSRPNRMRSTRRSARTRIS